MIAVALIAAVSGALAGAAPAPDALVIGVDTAGSTLSDVHRIPYWTHEPFYEALDDLGIGFVVVHLVPWARSGEDTGPALAKRMRAIDAAMKAHGLRYAFNLETPNFVRSIEVTPGRNEFAQPGGRHFWLVRPEWLAPILDAPGPRALDALIYDEAAHMQLSNNKYSDYPKDTCDLPFFVDTAGMPLEEAYDALTAECVRIRKEHYGGQIRLTTEQVWPDLFHIFARAGWTAAPKLLKEHLNAVVVSVALGAALQYEARGARFWASPDLWGVMGYPGHPPESLRSALLMAYWLGAERIYVENLDFDRYEARHPGAGSKGSLIHWTDPRHYELTAYGRVLREFAKDYAPAHPRPFDWRAYRPRVAIVRLPDGGWGQFDAGAGRPEAPSRNRLLGNRLHPLDKPASEWLDVWPILTHGVVKPGAITYHNRAVYPEMQDFFIPIDSVAVFDHCVEGAVLDSVECFVVCGHALSQATFDAIAERVEQGRAVCLIARRLYERCADGASLNGAWHIIDDFGAPETAAKLEPFLGPPDVARFRFAAHTVEFRKGDRPNRVEVVVQAREED